MKRILAAILLLTLAAPAWGQDYKKGLEAALRSDYVEAVMWYRKAAERDNVDAQHLLGILYNTGLFIPQDYVEAAKWYRRVVKRGDKTSQNNRGIKVKALAAANDEIENLARSGAAAQAVVERLEKELNTSGQRLQARENGQLKLQAQLAALNKELTETRARVVQLAAAATESHRVSTATLEVERQQSAVDLDKRKTEERASRLDEERQTTDQIRTAAKAAAEKNQALAQDLARALKANKELRAEADSLNTQAALLSKFLATARGEAKALEAERTSAIAKAGDLERDLAGSKDEAARLRASLEGTHDASAQLAARLAAAERRAATLSEDRREAVTRVNALAQELTDSRQAANTLRGAATARNADADRLVKELEAAKKTAAKQGAARVAAQNRVESLVASMAAAQAEVLNLRTRARQSDGKSDHLLEAVASLKAEAKMLATNLAALKGGAALTAASDILPQAGPSKETMIGAAAVPSSFERKLDTEPLTSAGDGAVRVANQRAGENQAAPRTASRDGSAKLMLARGDEYLGRGDIASARLFFEQAAEQGDTAALMAVGRTYDPRVLNGLGVLGAFANPAIATHWYERALSAGDEEAGHHIAALRAWRNR